MNNSAFPAEGVIGRRSRNVDTLRAIADGVTLDLDSAAGAQASAVALKAKVTENRAKTRRPPGAACCRRGVSGAMPPAVASQACAYLTLSSVLCLLAR